MSSEYLGLRLNSKKHKDIIKWLERFDDRSEEARRLMLLGIKVSSGEQVIRPKKSEPLVWHFPDEEPIQMPVIQKKPNLMANILGSFNE